MSVISAQEKEVYQGKFLGKLNSYHHQVNISSVYYFILMGV